MLREWLQCSVNGEALRDRRVQQEWNAALHASPYYWQGGPDGAYTGFRFETVMLQARALDALARAGSQSDATAGVAAVADADALKVPEWLPEPDALVFIAEHERAYAFCACGAAHPALLCAQLHAQLGGWDKAALTAEGILALPPVVTQPLVRIEAWRLLAQCREALSSREEPAPAAAREALEHGLAEARRVGYLWLEQVIQRELAPGVGEADPAARCESET